MFRSKQALYIFRLLINLYLLILQRAAAHQQQLAVQSKYNIQLNTIKKNILEQQVPGYNLTNLIKHLLKSSGNLIKTFSAKRQSQTNLDFEIEVIYVKKKKNQTANTENKANKNSGK